MGALWSMVPGGGGIGAAGGTSMEEKRRRAAAAAESRRLAAAVRWADDVSEGENSGVPHGTPEATPEENRENLERICLMVGTYAVHFNMDFEVFEDEEIVDLKKAIMDYKIDFAVCDPIYTRIIEEAIAFHEAKGKGKGKGTDSGMEEGG